MFSRTLGEILDFWSDWKILAYSYYFFVIYLHEVGIFVVQSSLIETSLEIIFLILPHER